MMSSRLQRLALRNCLPGSRRRLHLHEYQSKAIMASYGVNVQKGDVASTVEESRQVAARLIEQDAKDLVVKAQILAGGRGKGHFDNGFKGGVKLCHTADQVADVAGQMLGSNLITEQTGPSGQPVSKVLILKGINFDRELYFAILLDRTHDGIVVVFSEMGGMDIEKVAVEHPQAIHKFPVDIGEGLTDDIADKIISKLGFKDDTKAAEAKTQIKHLYSLFIEKDATQLEINPLVETSDHKVFCVDAKINFDDNAAFRHQKLFDQRDFSMEDPREVQAAKFNLNYIGLDGKIGCMVNGAGLAMATMDIIKSHGGTPANFLDVGGSATTDQVTEAFKILNNDKNVEVILVNIFGGIMKCDVIAQGIVDALKLANLSVPLVVRLEGTNVNLGKRIVEQSGLNITMATDLDDAAEKAVHALSILKSRRSSIFKSLFISSQ